MEISIEEYSRQERSRLIQQLCDVGTLRTERIAQAFLSIPREAFVSTIFEQEGFQWKAHTLQDTTPIIWLQNIYRDHPLISWVDDDHQRICSSSSAPTVMALMLEALELQPGMRVLEIGTGTGYNAALLATLVGDPSLLTTIEVEKELAISAQEKLKALVGPVYVQAGNGYDGCPLRAPYDRIIATASSGFIPRTWYEQLAPRGRLVIDASQETIIQLSLCEGVWSGNERGRGGLWQTILDSCEQWDQMGRPTQAAYHIQWDRQSARFYLLCEGTTTRQFDLSPTL